MLLSYRNFLLLFLLALGLVLPSQVWAEYSLCAFREGPRGPCTCKKDTDPPGQFTVVKRSKCVRRAPAKPAEAVEATPAAEQKTATTPADSTDKTEDGAADAAKSAPAPATPAAAAKGTATPSTLLPGLATGALPEGKGKLDEIRSRGKIRCGVNTGLLGFSARTPSGAWAGLDADFCRALAAAVFSDADKVEFVPVETIERFDTLKAGKIDVLSRNTTWTMSREIDLGVTFAGVIYFDGQGFMVDHEHGLVSAQQLSGRAVCVATATTTEKNVAYYFKTHQIEAELKTFKTREEMLEAYEKGECDAYAGDLSALFADRASSSEPAKHTILPEVISKQPLGPLVLAEDRAWVEIVRWTLAGLINAEEVGLDRASAASNDTLSDDAQRLVDGAAASAEKLKLGRTWLRDSVAAVGNYGEMFETNLGKSSPIGMNRGINALWKRGGILYAPPMW